MLGTPPTLLLPSSLSSPLASLSRRASTPCTLSSTPKALGTIELSGLGMLLGWRGRKKTPDSSNLRKPADDWHFGHTWGLYNIPCHRSVLSVGSCAVVHLQNVLHALDIDCWILSVSRGVCTCSARLLFGPPPYPPHNDELPKAPKGVEDGKRHHAGGVIPLENAPKRVSSSAV